VTVLLPPAAVLQAARAQEPEAVTADATWPARALLMDVYHAQELCWQHLKRFCVSLAEAGSFMDLSDVTATVTIHTTPVRGAVGCGACMHLSAATLMCALQLPASPTLSVWPRCVCARVCVCVSAGVIHRPYTRAAASRRRLAGDGRPAESFGADPAGSGWQRTTVQPV
jgi:hypothetical protein